ncbi:MULTISPECIES: helix-turn-helix transcriptional regulator [unclassified Nocardioides]|uniref:ArsR/SmtB family transcription factor n=1 Tax=unclassified Nocardioides TaxID=2615069 RepID=UPI002404F394|nr:MULTISPECIES: helix-turn-helix transcriptional regulator [unclassified Nocardioides]MDF9717938.1 ArsR family transcriptional regulator [Nocardioides sp. ChNu-99]
MTDQVTRSTATDVCTPVPGLPAVAEVAPVQVVLAALADPVRLEMVRRMAVSPERSERCSALYDDIGKSTASHHFKVLREAGLTERTYVDGTLHQRLRLDEVEERLPGLLPSVLTGLA